MLVRRALVLSPIALVVLIFVIAIAHFGPPGIKAGEDQVLSSMCLANGRKLFIVAHRTDSPFDAYEVSLYQVDQATNVFVCFLGHEESFWWGCSMRSESASNVTIRAYWRKVADYSLSDGTLFWTDKSRGDFPTYKIDGDKVKWPVPPVLATNMLGDNHSLAR